MRVEGQKRRPMHVTLTILLNPTGPTVVHGVMRSLRSLDMLISGELRAGIDT